MRHQADSWLVGDWVVFGAHVLHWAIVIAGLIVAALLVAWFERHKPARFSPPRGGALNRQSMQRQNM
jgi:hypothetical protein